MATLRVDTVSGIGTEGTVLKGGLRFRSKNYLTLPKGDTTQRGRGRGLWGGGTTGVSVKTIQYAELSSTGNTNEFGDLSTVNGAPQAVSSSTRCCYGGGNNHPSYFNKIEFVTIATTSNVTDFGDLNEVRSGGQGCGNETRGIFGPGFNISPNRNINALDFITIATLGNAQDFGDFTTDIRGVAACSSPTRGIFAGGYKTSSPNADNTIEFVTISTTGNATNFGDLTVRRMNISPGGCSNGIRGLFAGGVDESPNPRLNTIDFITIASAGDATDFGDLTVAGDGVGACSNSLRGVFGGRTTPSKVNTIDYVDIVTTGNAKDFGDTIPTDGNAGYGNLAGTSDSHGGLLE